MCGNFGLIIIQQPSTDPTKAKTLVTSSVTREHVLDELDRSLNKSIYNSAVNIIPSEMSVHSVSQQTLQNNREMTLKSMRTVSQLNRLRLNDSVHNSDDITEFNYDAPKPKVNAKEVSSKLLPLLKILESQASCTEIRGGQAGGISSLEFTTKGMQMLLDNDPLTQGEVCVRPYNTRVRCVGRKRFALAADLSSLFLKNCAHPPSVDSTVTMIGHTRFATASFNRVPELHPHEWVPFHEELVWNFHAMAFKRCTVGIHLSHNGDFDALEVYGQKLVVGDVGLWLERILHVPNDTKGDSPKLVGCFDLFCVQGRWGAAARLAYLRCILESPTNVSGGMILSKEAINTFPDLLIWEQFANLFGEIWKQHANNIIKLATVPLMTKRSQFVIDRKGEAQLRTILEQIILDHSITFTNPHMNPVNWKSSELQGFIYHTVRGFLRNDLYNSMTEILTRAEGSFGLQVHSTLEPGVVVLASKGQPMSLAFDMKSSLCLFGSEAEAVAVPVDESGRWLSRRLDLDNRGEVVRVGLPRLLIEGSFSSSLIQTPNSSTKNFSEKYKQYGKFGLRLDSGLEIRSYSLLSNEEMRMESILARLIDVLTAPVPYDPKVDLVAQDLAVTPATLSRIDEAWSNPNTLEYRAAEDLCRRLVECMKSRQSVNKDSIDLLIGGVEVSLWVAEQWAADLRALFPYLNIVTQSANKLLGLQGDSPGKIFFSGCEATSWRRIDENTCVILISQSGQTFPTLHATREIASLVGNRMWLLTGCFNSKMEQVMREMYNHRKEIYAEDRIFNNYSGNCPAEPTTVAIAATHHTLTRLMLHLVETTAKVTLPAVPAEGTEDPSVNKRKETIGITASARDHSSASSSSGGKAISAILTRNKKDNHDIVSIPDDISISDNVSVITKEGSDVTEEFLPLMTLAPSCHHDVRALLTMAVIPGIEKIVGTDRNMRPMVVDEKDQIDGEDIHEKLVRQGKTWAQHINEPWNILVIVGFYLFVSVGFGLPIFGVTANIVKEIVKAAGGLEGVDGTLSFSPFHHEMIATQPVVFTVMGVVIQMIDAVFYIYLAKTFTWMARYFGGRPLWARFGKRTLVIVDSPMVHQLTEIFVSKLFSQAYSFCSIDVHGANGLDHFVHRFTHRVVRGVLLAVGRPDGRLCCLAKSETAVLLATKQAVFIQNPQYIGDGSGPDVVTVGHSSFAPNLGLANHIVIPATRGAFLDEIIFEQLSTHPQASNAALELIYRLFLRIRNKKENMIGRLYGMKLIEKYVKESVIRKLQKLCAPMSGKLHTGDIRRSEVSYNPASSVAFLSKLDSDLQELLQKQRPLQQLYEGRIAALERYMSFCVMFHAMARECRNPWFRPEWNVARSQSNLRVATTACPVAVFENSESAWSREIHRIVRQLSTRLRGFQANM